MEVYLDNAATTRVLDEIIEKVAEMSHTHYGNPSSLHYKGMDAEQEIAKAKDILAKCLKVDKNELYFTSGGTESNNLALIGIAKAYMRSGKHIIISSIEHPSVSETAHFLEEEGFEITHLPVDQEGYISMTALEQAIREDTILVSIMYVNNEIGTIQKIDEIGLLIKRCNPNTIFHVDAVQAFGKLVINPTKWMIDALSISGHKIYAPKGIGALYIRNKVKIKPIIYGGSQQSGIRSGTENTTGIVALGMAAEFMYNNQAYIYDKIMNLRNRMLEGIFNSLDGVHINGVQNGLSAPHILNLRFDDVKGEVLLHALESKGIYISTGSACSSNKPAPSSTLKAIGLNNNQIASSVRISFSVYNTEEEIDYCVEQLAQLVPNLRKFVRK